MKLEQGKNIALFSCYPTRMFVLSNPHKTYPDFLFLSFNSLQQCALKLVCLSYRPCSASFTALAEVLGSKVCLSRDKYNTMCCLESEQVRQRITTDWKAAQVHVLPMMQLSFKVGAAVSFSIETFYFNQSEIKECF